MDTKTHFHLDTSVLMRLLVGAPLNQFRAAASFLEESFADGKVIAVADLVLAEAYFALQSAYGIPKEDAIASLAQFSQAARIDISRHAREILTHPNLAQANPGFVDRLIHGQAASSKAILVTFEKAAKQLPKTYVLA